MQVHCVLVIPWPGKAGGWNGKRNKGRRERTRVKDLKTGREKSKEGQR